MAAAVPTQPAGVRHASYRRRSRRRNSAANIFRDFSAPHDFFPNRVRIEPGVGEAVLDALRARGHELDIAPAWTEGFLCATERNLETGVLEAGCDPRGTKSEVFPACALAI